MKRSAQIVIIIVVVWVTLLSLQAQTASTPIDFLSLDTLITDELAKQQTPGLAIRIVHNGETMYEKGFGVRDTQTNAPVTPQTLFRIGSTSKPLTVIGILQQVEKGNIDLDAPVVTYIPEFAVSPTITVRQVLSMTAGLSDAVERIGRTDSAGLADYVANLTPKAQFTPEGTVFSYSNTGYSIAGLVLERVTGIPYADYMAKNVFPSLGMTHTTFYTNVAITFPVAVGYESTDAGLEPVRPNSDNIAFYPAGYAYSTVEDLARLGQFLIHDGVVDGKAVVSPELVHEMVTPVLGLVNRNFGYGLGTFGEDYRGTRTLRHDGAIDGYMSTFMTLPEYDFVVSMLASNSIFQSSAIVDQAVSLVLGLPSDAPQQSDVTLTTDQLSEFVGTYQQFDIAGNESITVTVTLQGDKLLAKTDGVPTLELKPKSKDVFDAYVLGTDMNVATIIISRDENAKASFFVVGLRALVRKS